MLCIDFDRVARPPGHSGSMRHWCSSSQLAKQQFCNLVKCNYVGYSLCSLAAKKVNCFFFLSPRHFSAIVTSYVVNSVRPFAFLDRTSSYSSLSYMCMHYIALYLRYFLLYLLYFTYFSMILSFSLVVVESFVKLI